MLKDNEHSTPIQLINQNIFNNVQEKTYYRLTHMMVSIFQQEKNFGTTQITTTSETNNEITAPSDDAIPEIKTVFDYKISR